MQKITIAAQMFSFRNYIKTPAGVRDTFRRLKRMGYDAIQLSGSIAPMPTADLAAMLRDEGLTAPTSHSLAQTIIDEPEKEAARLLELGCRHTAYPFPHWRPTGEGEVIELARQLNEAAKKFRAAGVTLAYHNHSVEFERFNGRPMLEILYAEAPELDAELDTYWVQKGGADPVRWIEQLSGRQQVLHLKDYGMKPFCDSNGSVMMPVGEGNLDWKRILDAADRAGVTCWVVEHDGDTSDPFGSFASSIRFLKENFNR